MKKIKLKDRLENAYQAFFDDEKVNKDNSLEYVHPQNASNTENNSFFSENTRNVFNILRQLFLFLPAASLLFLASVGLTYRLLFLLSEGASSISLLGFIMLLGLALTTILGLGNWRNPKHLSIPLSIVSVGVILGIIGAVFFGEFGFYDYVLYSFPLALIAPVLAKSWVDGLENETTQSE